MHKQHNSTQNKTPNNKSNITVGNIPTILPIPSDGRSNDDNKSIIIILLKAICSSSFVSQSSNASFN